MLIVYLKKNKLFKRYLLISINRKDSLWGKRNLTISFNTKLWDEQLITTKLLNQASKETYNLSKKKKLSSIWCRSWPLKAKSVSCWKRPRFYLNKDLSGTSKGIIGKIQTSTYFHARNIPNPIFRIIGTRNQTSLIQLDHLTCTSNKWLNADLHSATIKKLHKKLKGLKNDAQGVLRWWNRAPLIQKGGTYLAWHG